MLASARREPDGVGGAKLAQNFIWRLFGPVDRHKAYLAQGGGVEEGRNNGDAVTTGTE